MEQEKEVLLEMIHSIQNSQDMRQISDGEGPSRGRGGRRGCRRAAPPAQQRRARQDVTAEETGTRSAAEKTKGDEWRCNVKRGRGERQRTQIMDPLNPVPQEGRVA